MSRKNRVPFPYNRLAVLCLMAMPASQALAEQSTEGATVYVSGNAVSGAVGDYPLYAAGANSVLATDSEYQSFSSMNNSTPVAIAENGGALVIGGTATLAGSGSTADTVSLNNGSLTATDDVSINSSGTGSWGINAKNGAQISLESSTVNASGSSDGGILLGNNSTLTTTAKSKISASDKATGLQIKADSADTAAKATLTNTTVTAQDNHAISIVNGSLIMTSGAVSSSGENSNAITISDNGRVSTNSTNISTLGNGGDAIRLSGTKAYLTASDSTISTSGANAHAVHAVDSPDEGNAILGGGKVTTSGSKSYGLFTENATIAASGVAISTTGDNSVGAYASREGYINLTSSTSISTTGASATGIVSAADSYIIVDNATVTTSGANATAVLAEMGGVEASNSVFDTSGEGSVGLSSTAGTLKGENVTVTTLGDNAAAAYASRGSVTLTGTNTLTTSGTASAGILAASSGTVDATGVTITTKGTDAAAVSASDSSQVTLTDSTLSTTNTSSAGIFAASSGTVDATGVTITTNGTDAAAVSASDSGKVTLTDSTLSTTNTNSAGIFSGSAGTVTATNTTIATSNAAGVSVDAGSVSLTSSQVTTNGTDSAAVSASNSGTVALTDSTLSTTKVGSAGIVSETSADVTATNTTIETTGDNAAGISANAGSVALTGSTVTTSGAGSAGIFSEAAGSVTATGSDITTTGADAWAVSVNQGSVTVNNGTLKTSNAAGIFATGSDTAVPAGKVTLTDATIEAAQASVLSQGGLLDVNATGTTFNSATGLVLDVTTDAAGAYSTVNLNADSSTLNGSLVSDNVQHTSNVALTNGSSLTGYSQNISSVALDSTSSWNLTASSDVQSLTNNGTITFSEPTSGDFKTLTVNGDYTGNGGTLIMNSQLGDDSSPTDKLVVTGNVNAGDTLVAINNLGGTGAYTVEGIQIVNVGGVSEGTFTKSGRIVAGAYEYNLEKINESWYLTNKAPEITDPGVTDPGVTDPGTTDPGVTDPGVTDPGTSNPGVTDPGVTDPGTSNPGVTDPGVTDPGTSNPGVTDPGVTDPGTSNPGVTDPGVTDPGTSNPGVTDPGVTDPGVTPPGVIDPEPGPDRVSQYRPETGSYLANMLAANTMFDHRMQDRLGEGGYARSADGDHAEGLWMRHVGSHNRFYDDSGQLKARTNRYVLQMGMDLAQWSSDGYDRWHVGVMGGYGNAQSNIRSEFTGYRADSKVEGYSAGVYATWVESEQDMSGAYVDGWVLYNWFRNTINGEQLATERYDSKGFTASLEAGYTIPMSKGERVSSWLQPKVQLTWMDVGADNHREHNGTWVTDETNGMLRSRVGVRAYLKGHSKLDDNTGRDFQPFVEANWLHNFNEYSVKMDDATNSIAGDKNIGEMKLGVEGKIANDFTMWGNVAQQVGSAGYSDTTVMFGARLNF